MTRRSRRAELDEAVLTAFAVTCAYIFISSLALLFIRDFGRGAPSNLAVAAGVFVIAFAVSAARSIRRADRPVTARAAAEHAAPTLVPPMAAEAVRFDGSVVRTPDAPPAVAPGAAAPAPAPRRPL